MPPNVERMSESARLRQQAIPAVIHLAESLPIAAKADEIRQLLLSHQVLVVAGETGSGKTTQLPKICLQAGFGVRAMIGHTQPRRLAAVSVAQRIAQELGGSAGGCVGYQIRFSDRTSPGTAIKLMTDGILLNEIQRDRQLRDYEVLIVDEAHERSLNIDFILGYLHGLLARRPELKLIITSATIDLEKFSRHFNAAPVITVSGRSFPVAIRYQPFDQSDDTGATGDAQTDAILGALASLRQEEAEQRKPPGDVLVFLSSEKEIRETALALRKQRLSHTEVLPLYARLRRADQERIFAPHSGRRIILATNIAETSLTVPGIRYVIDSGLARVSRYSVQTKIQRLPIEPVAQANANQRAGRCGRVEAGTCIRLYSEADYLARPQFTDPEILRTNLAAVILQMLALGLGKIDQFPFLDPPDSRAVNDGFNLLYELNAIDEQRQLTTLGRRMAGFPVEPRFARILLAATRYDCLREILIIVSGLSIQDPREDGAAAGESAVGGTESDFLALVNLWNAFETQRQAGSGAQLRKYCNRNHLSYLRMLEWREVHRQLVSLCHGAGINLSTRDADYEPVHRSLVSGLLNFIGVAADNGVYQGTRNRKFRLFRTGSKSSPKWVVTAQIIETSVTFATMAARIEPEWVIYEAGHLVKRSWSEPHWSARRQQVQAYEKTTLYGLVLEDRKPVNYGPLDPEVSRELFIREGLVDQGLQLDLAFYRSNNRLMQALEREEEKIRRQSWLLDPQAAEVFYNARIPADVWDRQTLLAWFNQDRVANNARLTMQRSDLLSDARLEGLQQQFPDHAQVQHNRVAVNYSFEPGSEVDGAVIELPLALLAQLTEADLDWLIPGQRRERCIALIKSLPKQLRKQFIPVPAFVDRLLPTLQPGAGSLLECLIESIASATGNRLEKHQFNPADVPAYLQVKLKLLDTDGKVLAIDADLDALKRRFTGEAGSDAGSSRHPLEQTGLSDWTFDELPVQMVIGDRLKLVRYPALLDQGGAVDLRLLEDRQQAEAATRQGLARLFSLRTPQQRTLVSRQFQQLEKCWGLKRPAVLKDCADQALLASYMNAFQLDTELPRNRARFEQLLERNRSEIVPTAGSLAQLLDKIVDARFAIQGRTSRLQREQQWVLDDVNGQLARLLSPGFLLTVPMDRLKDYPRFLQAIVLRLEKMPLQADKDRQATALIHRFEQRWLARAGDAPPTDAALAEYRWMLEEFRVSLFAQQLKTRIPVSEQRLEKSWAKLMH